MITQATLPNGERVHVNDHVYAAPGWTTRDGCPYSIGRIMEFLQPEEKNGTSSKGKSKDAPTRVRLAWFYRPADVSDRQVADTRMLLSSIYSEIVPISTLRAKCHVKHKDKVSDLNLWKKKPDRFYFNRAFDPYVKKEFEVLRAVDVTNIPTHVRDVLLSRYEYIVCEKEAVGDLTAPLRLCETCKDWCANPESVQCDGCKNYYHMSCVQPPLAAKPARGYGWRCASCSRRHDEGVDSQSTRANTPAQGKTRQTNVRSRGRPSKASQNGVNGSVRDDLESGDHYFNMWPQRYFGMFTVPEDTLDPEDIIFLRAAPRIGPKFQVTVPPKPEQLPETGARPDLPERGSDETVELMSCICDMTPEEMADVEARKRALTERPDLQYSVDWIEEVIRRFSAAYKTPKFRTVNMDDPLRQRKWKTEKSSYHDTPWTEEEMEAFERGIHAYGPELRSVRQEVGTRTMPEVVRFYGHWKNDHIRHDAPGPDLLSTPSRPLLAKKTSTAVPSVSSDDEGSVISHGLMNGNGRAVCGACRTKESPVWWKAPKGAATSVLCDPCGTTWRKYGELKNARAVDDGPPKVKAPAAEKREGTPLTAPVTKRAKTLGTNNANSREETPPQPANPGMKQHLCYVCRRLAPAGRVAKCSRCSLSVHAGCYGVTREQAQSESWLCELCENEDTQESNLITDCLLCPRRQRLGKTGVNGVPPVNSTSYLRACKPTEGRGWVHVLCSAFTPGLTYTDASKLRLVEGIGEMRDEKWSTTCKICGTTGGGATIKCGWSSCQTEFHVSCAWNTGLKFGLEIVPPKKLSANQKELPILDFKSESGVMCAHVWCDTHTLDGKAIFNLCESNEYGETAFQVFCETYKQAPMAPSYGLLRKATRLDKVMPLIAKGDKSAIRFEDGHTESSCARCKTEYSPYFWPRIGQGHNEVYCQRCRHEIIAKDDKEKENFPVDVLGVV